MCKNDNSHSHKDDHECHCKDGHCHGGSTDGHKCNTDDDCCKGGSKVEKT